MIPMTPSGAFAETPANGIQDVSGDALPGPKRTQERRAAATVT